jgi:hypothetical protein
MTRLASVLAILASGCLATSPGIGVRASSSAGPGYRGAPPPPPPPPPPRAPAHDDSAFADGEDRHWFTADDYLISAKPFEGKKLVDLRVAKMVEPPSAATQRDARFLEADGDERWTSTYWKSQVAAPGDLAIGTRVFCPAGRYDREVKLPTKKRDSRQHAWIFAPVTDTAHAYQGWVTVGDTTCDIRAVRIPIR